MMLILPKSNGQHDLSVCPSCGVRDESKADLLMACKAMRHANWSLSGHESVIAKEAIAAGWGNNSVGEYRTHLFNEANRLINEAVEKAEAGNG